MKEGRQNYRFKVWIHGGEVTLTIRTGETLRWGYSMPDEEGYSFMSIEWTADTDGVYRDSTTGGRDCDGRVSHTHSDFCPYNKLTTHVLTQYRQTKVSEGEEAWLEMVPYTQPGWPAWEQYRVGEVYDEYARAAGY